VLLKHISDCLWGDWVGNDGVDVFGGLNSIGRPPSGDLGDDGSFIGGRKPGRTTRRWSLSIRKEVLKDSRHSRLPNTKFGSNLTSGKTIGSKGHDVFLLSRGDGMCYNTVWTPTLCKPDTSDRPYCFSFYLLNLATPLLSYAVRLVLLTLVPLSSLPCYLYDAVLILTLDILYSLIDTFLSILRYISTHVFVVEP
jgi:hypothetical protein